MDSGFFQVGRVYEHFLAGQRSGVGVLWVQWVGVPPPGFEESTEMAGVAAGWHRGIAAYGVSARGWYSTTDYQGWVEVPESDRAAALAGHPPYDYAVSGNYRQYQGRLSPAAPEPC